jgi:hypothetical protein
MSLQLGVAKELWIYLLTRAQISSIEVKCTWHKDTEDIDETLLTAN